MASAPSERPPGHSFGNQAYWTSATSWWHITHLAAQPVQKSKVITWSRTEKDHLDYCAQPSVSAFDCSIDVQPQKSRESLPTPCNNRQVCSKRPNTLSHVAETDGGQGLHCWFEFSLAFMLLVNYQVILTIIPHSVLQRKVGNIHSFPPIWFWEKIPLQTLIWQVVCIAFYVHLEGTWDICISIEAAM